MRTALTALAGLALIIGSVYLFAAPGSDGGPQNPGAAAAIEPAPYVGAGASDQAHLDSNGSFDDVLKMVEAWAQQSDAQLQAAMSEKTDTARNLLVPQATTSTAAPAKSSLAPVTQANTQQAANDVQAILNAYNILISQIGSLNLPADAKAPIVAALQGAQAKIQAATGQTAAYSAALQGLADAVARVNALSIPADARTQAIGALQNSLGPISAMAGMAAPTLNTTPATQQAATSAPTLPNLSSFSVPANVMSVDPLLQQKLGAAGQLLPADVQQTIRSAISNP